jgi:hypothetical protein
LAVTLPELTDLTTDLCRILLIKLLFTKLTVIDPSLENTGRALCFQQHKHKDVWNFTEVPVDPPKIESFTNCLELPLPFFKKLAKNSFGSLRRL